MFRTASITFHTARFGGETVTDLFRVWFVQDQQDTEVRASVSAAGVRDFKIIRWAWAD